MAPVTNEILGGASAQESAPQSAKTESKSPSQRADAVSLEVPIKVHGSRGGSGANSQSERFEEQTTTMIVFPEGGVLRMATSVASGQMLVLTNQKSRQDVICRVVKVRTFSDSQSYVEVEFTRAQPAYWGVSFASHSQASDSIAPIRPPIKTLSDPLPGGHTAAPAEPPAPELIENIADLHETKHARLPLPAPPKPQSPFASIGTHEKIQPSAAATTPHMAARKPAVPPVVGESISTKPAPIQVSERVPAGTVANLNSLADLDDVTAAAKAAPSSDSFGIRLDSKLESASAEPRQNSLLIAASIALLLAAAAGGAWYFHSHFAKPVVPASAGSAGHTVQNAVQNSHTPVAPAIRQEALRQSPSGSAGSDPGNGTLNTSANPGTGNSGGGTHSPVNPASEATNKSAEQSHAPVESSVPTLAAPTPAPARNAAAGSLLSDAAMKAHPLSSQRSISSPGDAPVLSVESGSAHDAGGLGSIGSSKVAVPPPPAAATPQGQAAVHVGGAIKQPKLIHSVLPVYPLAARQANIQGDVVIDTRIAPNGSVSNMKVVSGPTMLRQAALEALRRWRYQPSELDGKPAAVQILVTIRFRL